MAKMMKFLGRASVAAAAVVGVTGVASAHEAGWTVSVEEAFVKAHASEGNLPSDNGFGYDAATRLVLGYETENGLGARFRYYNYDESAGTEEFRATLERTVYDFEATQAFDFASGGVTVAAGVRYIDASSGYSGEGENGVGYTAWGVTAAVEGWRNLGMEGLALTASARWSATYGDTDYDNGGSDDGDLHNSVEIRLGPQYTFAMNGAHAVTVGAGVEAEYLNNEPVLYTDTQDAGFIGMYVNVGTRF